MRDINKCNLCLWLNLEFVNCVMFEKDFLFVLLTNQAPNTLTINFYLEYHAYKLRQ